MLLKKRRQSICFGSVDDRISTTFYRVSYNLNANCLSCNRGILMLLLLFYHVKATILLSSPHQAG